MLKPPRVYYLIGILSAFILLVALLTRSFSSKNKDFKERIERFEPATEGSNRLDTVNGIGKNQKLTEEPGGVLVTGIDQTRIVPIYYYREPKKEESRNFGSGSFGSGYPSSDEPDRFAAYFGSDELDAYPPGFRRLAGYFLTNLLLYKIEPTSQQRFFPEQVLVKSLYFPSPLPDTLPDKRIVSRNYFLCSVYDEDTDKDTMITPRDLRHFYRFVADLSKKTSLLPLNYSVFRSQYDAKADLLYLYAREDVNQNGFIDKKEPTRLFYIRLANPEAAVRIY